MKSRERRMSGLERKKAGREARKRAIQAKWPAGKPKNRRGNQNRRPDDDIPGRDGKTSPGRLETRRGTQKTPPGS
jgi:hypothetical protein